MTDEQPIGQDGLQPDQGRAAESQQKTGGVKSPPDGKPDAAPAPESAAAKTLTPEEQMALYEKELKEDDWGHQPC